MPSPGLPLAVSFRSEKDLQPFSYYGHQQLLAVSEKGLELGALPADPVNAYRSGEKLVLDGGEFADFTATTRIAFLKGDHDAGLLFRVADPSVGFDAQRGYFAGIIPNTKSVVLGKTDGSHWKEIARAPLGSDPAKPMDLGVTAKGPDITITLDGKPVLTAEDDTYAKGTLGLRVVDTHVRFDGVEAKAID